MKTRPVAVLAFVLASLGGLSSGSAGEGAPAQGPDDVMRRIDAALFLPDGQAGLAGYECDATATEAGRSAPTPIAKVRLDAAAGTRTWTDPKGDAVPPGTWDPPCGGWRLIDLLRVELDLLAAPLSKRFDADRWDREAVELAEGSRLSLAARRAAASAASAPTALEILLRVGKDGVPTGGEVHVRGGAMAVLDATFALRYEPEGNLRRLVGVENSLTSGAWRTRATLTLSWAKEEGFLLPRAVALSVPLSDLLEAPDVPADRVLESTLAFSGYVVQRAAPPAAEPQEPKPPAVPPAPAASKPKYVGDRVCMKCHLVEHRSWKKGPLASSLTTLRPTDEATDTPLFAKKTAAGLDPKKDYSTDASCVRCHVTGYGEAGGYPTDPAADDEAKARAEAMGKVSCEACHGPGEAYVAFKQKQASASVPVTVAQLLPLGLVVPDEKGCRACHNGEGPTKASFSFEDAKTRVHEHKKR